MNSINYKIGAVVFAAFLIGSLLTLPMTGAITVNMNKDSTFLKLVEKDEIIIDEDDVPIYSPTEHPDEPIQQDTFFDGDEGSTYVGEQNDVGYNTDVGDTIQRSAPLYVGEPVDQTVPGRGRAGTLDYSGGDDADWYRFSITTGQSIQASASGASVEIADTKGNPVGTSYTATETGNYFVRVYTSSGGSKDYTFTVTINGQNDANTGNDAGDAIESATSINPGEYSGYMDYNDVEDWYAFSANSGQGIFVTIEPFDKSDFDIHLYNPSGNLVHSAMYYGDDELEYPADASGTWKIKIDMFPGWDESKWPDNYFLYGSGVYEMSLSIGGSASSPPGPIPQPGIVPVAQTITINNDPNSNDDEYQYLAAVPAAVYKQGGKQYVSPIVYNNDNYQTHWYGDADDTTQYLLDDWNDYLQRHYLTAEVYEITENPIKAAANIATTHWKNSDTAVLAMDGSDLGDTWNTIIDSDETLEVKTATTTATPDDPKFSDFAGFNSIQMFVSKEWGSMTVYAHGSDCPAVGVISMRYENAAYEDWPHPYDTPGDNTNIYMPITIPGLYWPYVDSLSGFNSFEITRYSGDRYKVPISNTDSSLKVTVTTSSPSYLEVFLIDPYGSVRRPSMPSWNGGPINPIHIWNGDHHNGFEQWRRWEPTYSTEHTAEINYPMEGKWTVIVTPHYPYGNEKSVDTIPYHIKVEQREHNMQRVDAGLSAANGAVIASQTHSPLLYVTENSVPVETQEALNILGVKEVVFVNINDVSKAQVQGTVTELNSMQEVLVKTGKVNSESDIMRPATQSDNVIVITSFGTEDGFFAPAGLIAAYHGSNVLNIGEVPDAYNTLDKATAFREYDGGWYHGTRSQGHLAKMSESIPSLFQLIRDFLSGDFPELGLDQHLRWWGDTHDAIYNWISGQGLDQSGQEAYIFVAPRNTDIRHPICRVMSGIGSYAGQIPFDTPGLDSALICRDILYPALIYVNPGKDVTTAQLMNFPDGWQWRTNDGKQNTVYSTRELKEAFFSHGRFFEGHVLFDNWLDRINYGACINYYSGHGTGGSGISAQYSNVAEDFPYAELRHESLHDFDWWDSWRGYMYDDEQTKTARWGGFTWYNAAEPNLYDIIHFKWVDQLLDNLHSEIELWMSCTTGQHFGPEIYLEHGSALWYGNAGTGLCPQEDLLDDAWIGDMMINGLSVGQAFSKYAWLHQRDFTAKNVDTSKYNAAMYGTSSMQVTNVQVLFGDPTMTCYSPDWTEPIPVNP